MSIDQPDIPAGPETCLLINQYQQTLQSHALVKTSAWWERYMRGVIPFRGVGIPQNRKLLASWRIHNGIDQWSAERQLELALAFFAEPYAEDKLAGILYLQNHLQTQLPWQILLDRYQILFAKELIFDWNCCDWFCVRLMGPMIKLNGPDCALAVSNWKDAPYLWQARAALVSFINLDTQTQYIPLIFTICTTLIHRDERFAKTAVGWILHDISKHRPDLVSDFVHENLSLFSVESLKNALKYYDPEQRIATVKQFKKTLNKS